MLYTTKLTKWQNSKKPINKAFLMSDENYRLTTNLTKPFDGGFYEGEAHRTMFGA